MFKIIFILLCFVLVSCQSPKYGDRECIGDYACTDLGDKNDENDVEEKEDIISLEGYYRMPYGGEFELTKLNDGRYRIEMQYIYSRNYDGGFAYHPSVHVGPHAPRANGTIVYVQNHNYSNTTHDIERDGSTSNVTGTRRTEYIFRINKDGLFEYEVKIRRDTSPIGNVDVHRILVEEEQ